MDTEVVTAEQPVEAPEPSFAEHEAAFSNRPKLVDARQTEEASPASAPVPAPESGDSTTGERDPKGRYTRAKSQQATVDDVPTISALTKEYHDALTEAGFTVEKKQGESDRVFGLRQRAELAKALRDLKKTPPPVAPVPIGQSGPSPSIRPNGGDSGALPTDFRAKPKAEDFTDYTDFLDELSQWNAEATYVKQERQREQRTQAQSFAQSVQSRYAAAKERYPDFEQVVLNPQANSPIQRGSVIERFTFKHATGPDVAYHFFKHPEEVAAIHALPDADDQIAALSLLGQRLTQKIQGQVATTRSTAPAVTTPIVKPPNLVRTGVVKASDEPPGDDASFAEHEKTWGTSKRRR